MDAVLYFSTLCKDQLCCAPQLGMQAAGPVLPVPLDSCTFVCFPTVTRQTGTMNELGDIALVCGLTHFVGLLCSPDFTWSR